LIATLVLAPGLSRAESRVERLVVPAGAQLAHIEVQLEPRDDFPRYRAELRTRRGDEVLTRGRLVKQGTTVGFDAPASALATGDYELALKGVNGKETIDIGYYYFHVERYD